MLKARLLDKLEKIVVLNMQKFGKLCENMNNYFESNVKDSFSFDTAQINKSDFKNMIQVNFDCS